MRQIKFRGRDNNGNWHYGDLVHFPQGEFVRIHDYDENVGGYRWFSNIDPATVAQFTGLHDKHDREIYEGDILLWIRKNVHIEGRPLQDFLHKCIVYYDNDKCAFQFRCELRCGACVGYLDFDDDRADESFVEVIGNIHDNKSLLEKGGEQ